MSRSGTSDQAKPERRPPVEQTAEHLAGESIVVPRPPISIYCEHYQAVIELIGRRWMGAILRVLMSDGALAGLTSCSPPFRAYPTGY